MGVDEGEDREERDERERGVKATRSSVAQGRGLRGGPNPAGGVGGFITGSCSTGGNLYIASSNRRHLHTKCRRGGGDGGGISSGYRPGSSSPIRMRQRESDARRNVIILCCPHSSPSIARRCLSSPTAAIARSSLAAVSRRSIMSSKMSSIASQKAAVHIMAPTYESVQTSGDACGTRTSSL